MSGRRARANRRARREAVSGRARDEIVAVDLDSDAKFRQLDQSLDEVVARAVDPPVSLPPVLYHYTTKSGLDGILTSAAMRATRLSANDPEEFRAADAAVLAAAQSMANSGSDRQRFIFTQMMKHYGKFKAASHVPGHLTCFSEVRDSDYFWQKAYTETGRGYCLGIRLLAEPPPDPVPGWAFALGRVEYGDSDLHAHFLKHFQAVVALVETVPLDTAQQRTKFTNLVVAAVFRIAAGVSVLRKTQQWQPEREWRRIAFARAGADARNAEEFPMRRGRARIALSEIIVGPMQDFQRARASVEEVLRSAGYVDGSSEWPAIVPSATTQAHLMAG